MISVRDIFYADNPPPRGLGDNSVLIMTEELQQQIDEERQDNNVGY